MPQAKNADRKHTATLRHRSHGSAFAPRAAMVKDGVLLRATPKALVLDHREHGATMGLPGTEAMFRTPFCRKRD